MKVISVQMDHSIYGWLVTYSKENDLSISQTIRQCIRQHKDFTPAAEPVKTPNTVSPQVKRDVLSEWSDD